MIISGYTGFPRWAASGLRPGLTPLQHPGPFLACRWHLLNSCWGAEPERRWRRELWDPKCKQSLRQPLGPAGPAGAVWLSVAVAFGLLAGTYSAQRRPCYSAQTPRAVPDSRTPGSSLLHLALAHWEEIGVFKLQAVGWPLWKAFGEEKSWEGFLGLFLSEVIFSLYFPLKKKKKSGVISNVWYIHT